jgi:hypothetical protein
MKKFLRFCLPLFLVVIALGFCLIGYIADGKVIFPAKNAVIKIDGIEQSDAKIFETDESFYIVLEPVREFDLLILVKPANDVVLPNGNCREVIFSNYLFLDDCAKGKFYGSDLDFQTQLKISDSNIDFVIPNHKIEILFKGE